MINRVVINRACSYEDMHHLTEENGKKKIWKHKYNSHSLFVSHFLRFKIKHRA